MFNLLNIPLARFTQMPLPPDPTADEGISNDDRAAWAEVALLAFARRTGMLKEQDEMGNIEGEDPFLVLADLLADLGHWCDRNGVDFPSALTHAAGHYAAESDGQGPQLKP